MEVSSIASFAKNENEEEFSEWVICLVGLLMDLEKHEVEHFTAITLAFR